mmetsp:Transcript_148973/g.260328  ORF Transcript_148973/g.260328 Transcript_148973/m.260328 type:complete len:256 (-) Transcript_148973:1052-1819(-)
MRSPLLARGPFDPLGCDPFGLKVLLAALDPLHSCTNLVWPQSDGRDMEAHQRESLQKIHQCVQGGCVPMQFLYLALPLDLELGKAHDRQQLHQCIHRLRLLQLCTLGSLGHQGLPYPDVVGIHRCSSLEILKCTIGVIQLTSQLPPTKIHFSIVAAKLKGRVVVIHGLMQQFHGVVEQICSVSVDLCTERIVGNRLGVVVSCSWIITQVSVIEDGSEVVSSCKGLCHWFQINGKGQLVLGLVIVTRFCAPLSQLH